MRMKMMLGRSIRRLGGGERETRGLSMINVELILMLRYPAGCMYSNTHVLVLINLLLGIVIITNHVVNSLYIPAQPCGLNLTRTYPS